MCLRGASAVQRLLDEQPAAGVRVYTIWEPIQPMDIARPTSTVLRRLHDPRVQQYWDPQHAVSAQMQKDARPPQPSPECCDRNGKLWDLAAVYPAGVSWTAQMPAAMLFNGTVVDLIDPLRSALSTAASR